MFVKVCGLSTEADVVAAVEAGADAIGFVLSPSPRQVEAETARRLGELVPESVLTTAVMNGVPADRALALSRAAGVRAVQLHGGYPRQAFSVVADMGVPMIRATSLTADTDISVGAYGEEYLLLDAPVAGAGRRWDLALLQGRRPAGRWLLAGGLTPHNVVEAITQAAPWGVDVSSGVESSRGVKDPGLIKEFLAAAKGTD